MARVRHIKNINVYVTFKKARTFAIFVLVNFVHFYDSILVERDSGSTQLRVNDNCHSQVTFRLLVIPHPHFSTKTSSRYPVSSTVLKL